MDRSTIQAGLSGAARDSSRSTLDAGAGKTGHRARAWSNSAGDATRARLEIPGTWNTLLEDAAVRVVRVVAVLTPTWRYALVGDPWLARQVQDLSYCFCCLPMTAYHFRPQYSYDHRYLTSQYFSCH